MREQSTTLTDLFNVGLRPDKRNALNAQAFTVLTGLKPTPYGLANIPLVSTPLGAVGSWPFPQILKGKKLTLLADEDAISVVDEDGWTTSALSFRNPADTDAATVVAGGSWHFIDFFDTWMLLNGSCVAYHTNKQLALGQADKWFVQSTISLNTGCAFRGRALFGGLNALNYFSADVLAFWESWNDNVSTNLTVNLDMDTNFVTWTRVGGGDLLWPLHLDEMLQGYTNVSDYNTTTKPMLLEQMLGVNSGFMPIPSKGRIHRLLPLESGVVVYSANGVGFLYPANVDDRPMFGYRHLLNIGIQGRGAVAGDDYEHVFMDYDGWLWKITNEVKPTRIGYKEFFQPMWNSANMIITFNPDEREFNISDGNICYLLTQNGLCRRSQRISSLVKSANDVVGVAV